MNEIILITGCHGQIGSELTLALREKYSEASIIGLDIQEGKGLGLSKFLIGDITNQEQLTHIFEEHKPTLVFHLAAILSARGEQNPMKAWNLNMNGLLNILELCTRFAVKKVFWPSTIAVFGKESPKEMTPQNTLMNPSTIYGISKMAGERWCEYYHAHWNLDVRSIRYPGIISWKTAPGGGTTDYAVEIFKDAFQKKQYTCFLSAKTTLPMMDMRDMIRATLELMDADSSNISIRDSYNLAGVSFSPEELAEAIRKHIPDFKMDYLENDPRQAYADSWPQSIDDSVARRDWHWKPQYALDDICEEMLKHAAEIP